MSNKKSSPDDEYSNLTYSRAAEESSAKNFSGRPDLSGQEINRMKFGELIGRGGYGDVYITPDRQLCIKVIFESDCRGDSFLQEQDAVRFISQNICKHCGIQKILLGAKNAAFQPWPPPEMIPSQSREYERFYACDDCHKQLAWHEQRFFYYGMAAADDLEVSTHYVPDTLGNRLRHNKLDFSPEKKFSLCMETLDSLLFLYKEIGIAHGDVKPGNIFLVNGHASLGDFGCTMDIHNEAPNQYESPAYAPSPEMRREWAPRTDGDIFTQRILNDLFALGKTARALLVQNEENNPIDDLLFSNSDHDHLNELISFCSQICSEQESVSASQLVDRLETFRWHFLKEYPNVFELPRAYKKKVPLLDLPDFAVFLKQWKIIQQIDERHFLVCGNDIPHDAPRDILLAEILPFTALRDIRKQEELASVYSMEGPLMIYRFQDGTILVLSHQRGKMDVAKTEEPRIITAFGKAMLDSVFHGSPKNFDIVCNGHREKASCSDFLKISEQEKKILLKLHLPENAAVLDWGCGIGRHLQKIRKHKSDIICYGVDIDDGMLEYCRKTVAGPAFFCKPGQFQDNIKFDLIMLMGNGLGIFGTEEKVIANLNKFKNMLTPDGILLFETGNPMGRGYSTVRLENIYENLHDGPFEWGGGDRAWAESAMNDLGLHCEIIPDREPSHHGIFFYTIAKKN